MKIASTISTILLIVPIMRFLRVIFNFYAEKTSLNTFGVSDEKILSFAMPSFIFLGLYSLVFTLTLFLNLKKKYLASVIVACVMMLFYLNILIMRW
jgi:hypothetical protein